MILRILRGRAARADLASLIDAVRVDVDDWSTLDGAPVSVQPAIRDVDREIEFLLTSTWTTAESVIARGGEVSLPRGRLGTSGLLRDARAEHYELMLDKSSAELRAGMVVRVSSMSLVPGRSTGFYERVRRLWDQLVGDAGLVATHVGRRVGTASEHAVVLSVWDSLFALDAATTAGGFVGGDDMRVYYATEPTIEHFTALDLEPATLAASASD